jgi:hypothetical protein
MRTFALMVLVFVVALGCAWVAWTAYQPARRPGISITLLGYTNNTAGARCARIGVTNLLASAVELYLPEIEVRSPATPGGSAFYHSGSGFVWDCVLSGGGATNLTLQLPTNQPLWRVSLYAYPDVGAARVWKRVVFYTFLKVGLKPRYQTMPFFLKGAWIGSQK